MTNFSQYFAIEKKMNQRGFDTSRSELVAQFTNEKKTGLKELTAFEYREFCQWLNRTFLQDSKPPVNQAPIDPVLQKQRRKIIALLAKIGFIDEQGNANMPRIYAWVDEYGYLHKSLNKYTASELPKLVLQAEKFYKSHIERL